MKNNIQGFTLIELILVVTLLGILAVSALPKFYDVRAAATVSSHKAVAGGINDALGLFRSDAILNNTDIHMMEISPLVADGGTCSPATPCFNTLLNPGITDNKWIKMNIVTYIYNGTTTYNYLAPSMMTKGTFMCVAGCE